MAIAFFIENTPQRTRVTHTIDRLGFTQDWFEDVALFNKGFALFDQEKRHVNLYSWMSLREFWLIDGIVEPSDIYFKKLPSQMRVGGMGHRCFIPTCLQYEAKIKNLGYIVTLQPVAVSPIRSPNTEEEIVAHVVADALMVK